MTTTERNEQDVPWLLRQLVAAIDRMERRQRREAKLLDEFRRAYLNARFPYGEAQDRWHRRG